MPPVAAAPTGASPSQATNAIVDEPEPSFAASAPASAPPVASVTTRTDESVEMPAAPAPTSAPTTSPSPEPVAATTADEDTVGATRGLQLVFDGVPGYQQAAAIERAVGDLVEDGEVEIIEFEQGQLVLQVEAANPRALADRLMAKSPLPMRLVASGQDSATFQLTAG